MLTRRRPVPLSRPRRCARARWPARGPAWLYGGEVAERICDWVCERGGTLSAEDFAAYEVIEREPVEAAYRGRDVLTNPPPSSGGILIAYALDLLERLGEPAPFDDPDALQLFAEVMARGRRRAGRTSTTGCTRTVSRPSSSRRSNLERAAAQVAARLTTGGRATGGEPLGSTTHISALDADGNAASVTCSNGTGSGVMPPGTGIHLNNMLGEEDLNPLGFHRLEPGTRVTSMMAPTIVLRDGEVELSLGSAGSNRLRSAILQVIRNVVDYGMDVAEAVRAGRIHYEAGDAARRAGLQCRVAGRAGAPRLRRRALEGTEPLLRRRAGRAQSRPGRGAGRRRRPTPRRRRRGRGLTRNRLADLDLAVPRRAVGDLARAARGVLMPALNRRASSRSRAPSERSSSRPCFTSRSMSTLAAIS